MSERPERSRESASPYVELDRDVWAELAGEAELPLDDEQVARIRGLGDFTDLEEARQVYLPLAELIALRIRAAAGLHRATEKFLGNPQPQRTPYVIGIAGSVAVGKSTSARLIRDLLRAGAGAPTVELVTTDGFLLSNAELERRGLLQRKGFPESYDRKALLRFVMAVKSGAERVEAPVYDHLTYDVTDEVVTVVKPDVVIIEGLNVLAPARQRGDGAPGLAVSDFFDFSIYVDARSRDIKQWYVERFMRLRETAFANPDSYFHRYASFSDEEAVSQATYLWDTINWPNLRENILTTRGRADAVLRKDEDHSIKWVRLRKM